MKAKRFLAMLLCVIMIAGDASLVNAAETNAGITVENEITADDTIAVEEIEEVTETVNETVGDVSYEGSKKSNTDAASTNENKGKEESVEDIIEVIEDVEEVDSNKTQVESVKSSAPTDTTDENASNDETVEDIVAPDEMRRIFKVDENGYLSKVSANNVPYSNIIIPNTIGDAEVRGIAAGAFEGDEVIGVVKFETGSKINFIGERAFANCSKLTEVILPSPVKDGTITYEVTEIKPYTFIDSNIETIQYSGCKIETIGKEAFKNTNLAYFSAEGTVRHIEESAFAECLKLARANLSGVETIGKEAFMGCSNLAKNGGTVDFDASLTQIGSRAFKSSGIVILNMEYAYGLRGAGCLGDAVFEDCQYLTTVITPSAIPEIPTRMFAGCKRLKTVSIGYSNSPYCPSVVGREAFADCVVLDEITIPYTVSEIKTKAFSGCTKLRIVDIDSKSEYITISKDAFPARGKDLYMRGYTNTVKYFANEHEFTWVNKTQTYKTELEYDTECGEVAISSIKPKEGDTVTVTISPKAGYTLHASGGKFINSTELDSSKKFVGFPNMYFWLDSCSRNADTKLDTIVFKFVMPSLKEKDNILKLSFYLDKDNAFSTKESNLRTAITDPKLYTFIDGNPAQLVFNETGNNTSLEFYDTDGRQLGPWRFNFKVKDDSKEIVRVTPEGLVTARYETGKEGSIIATLNSTGKQYPIHVTVRDKVTVRNMWFAPDYTPGAYPNKMLDSYPYRLSETVVYNEGKEDEYTKVETKEYQLITIPKSSIKKSGGSFKVRGLANYDGEKYSIVDTTWKSSAEGIAKVSKPTSLDGINTITIPKTAIGETIITVTAINYAVKEGEPGRTFVGGFVVRVVDDTPRLVSNIITINANSDKGTKLPLIVMKEFPVDNNIIYFSQSSNLDKTKNYEDLEIVYDFAEDAYYAKASATLINKMKSNSVVNLQGLYLRGEVNYEPFCVPVGTVYVERKKLSPTFNITNSINLFYKTTDGLDPERKYSGSVLVNQSLTRERVERYVLLTKENHLKVKAREATVDDFGDKSARYYDELQNNFDISIYDTEMGIGKIVRSEKPLEKDKNNKVITSGYLYAFYKGYTDPVVKKITIPTEVTKPKLVLSSKTRTAHASQSKELYQLMLFDSETLTLPKLEYRDKYDEKYYVYDDVLSDAEVTFDMSSNGTTRGLFEEPTISKVENVEFKDPNDSSKKVKISVNKINLKLRGSADAGKAVLNVKRANWEEPIKATFKLKVVTKDAKAVIAPNKVTLNVKGGNTKGEIKVTFDKEFATFVAPDSINDIIEYVGSDRLAYDAGKIRNSMNFSISANDAGEPGKQGKLTISISGNSVSKGTYKFAISPIATYTGDAGKNLKKVKFSVVVTDKEPLLKLKASTFTLNGKYPGSEKVQQEFSVSNMPKGDYELDFSEMVITAKSKPRKNTNDAEYMETIIKQISANFVPKVDNEIEKKPAYMSLGFIKGTKAFPENCSYKFIVKGVKVIKDGQPIEVNREKDLVITIKVNTKAPTVTQTKKGTINPIDPLSDVVYTAKVSKINGKIISVNCVELDKYNVQIPAEENHFNVELITQEDYDDDDTGLRDMYNIKLKKKKVVDNQVLVTWKKTNAIEKDKKYKIQLVYYLDIEGVPAIYSTDLSIKPKQTMPQLATTLIKPLFDTSSLLPTADLTGNKLEKAETKADELKTQNAMTAVLYPDMKGNDEAITRVTPGGVKKAKVTRVWLKKNTERDIRRAFDVLYYRVDPNKDNSNIYYVKDISGNSIEVRFGTLGQVISANKINFNPKADDFTERAIELAKAERVYRASFRKDKTYLKGDEHYYVVVKLINSGLVPRNKQFTITVETQFENMYKDTNGSRYKLNVLVKK